MLNINTSSIIASIIMAVVDCDHSCGFLFKKQYRYLQSKRFLYNTYESFM